MPGKVGKPLKVRSKKELQSLIDAYFAANSSLSLSGLCLALGLAHRRSLNEYEQNAEYGNIIKRARLKVEEYYEKLACTNHSAAGPIFILKNMGWSDRQEIEHSGQLTNIIRYPYKRPGPIGDVNTAVGSDS